MFKKLSYIIFNIVIFFDKIFKILTKRSFIIWFPEFLQEKSYRKVRILKKDINFFVPNHLINWRLQTYFTKEPDTLKWIDSFEKKENMIFWDIGANIGLYSIYSYLRNPKSTTIAFEPSTSNLRVLSRNISINNLEENIKILPIPLTNKINTFQQMHEESFIEGGGLNFFGEKSVSDINKYKTNMKYILLGTTINFFIENSILDIPDYIKIDVDGIEHLILEGGDKFLHHEKIKSVCIEIDQNNIIQYEKILSLMKNYNFNISYKSTNHRRTDSKIFQNETNYIFTKHN